jgi:hypothetical protein
LSQNEGLASSDWVASSSLALGALKSKGNLLGVLTLVLLDGLGLTTISLLLGVISSLSLGEEGSLSCLVLSHLVGDVSLASWAVSFLLLWAMNL